MVTLADVARHAGVSASTVSYVLSGKRSISEATRARVEAAIRQLGYHPHAGARALASNRSSVIALMVPLRGDMYVPVIMEIVTAVAAGARSYDQDVLLLTGDEGMDGVRRISGSGIADAVILMDVEIADARIPALQELATPAVLLGRPDDPGDLACVDLDFEAAGALCVHHLADLGHRRVAFLGEGEGVYRRGTSYAVHTLRGVRRAAADRGLTLAHRPFAGSYAATAAVLARIQEELPDVSAYVVQNETSLSPLVALLRARGLRVPEDVSVVAVAPEDVALRASVPLTGVAVPAEEMGRTAVETVMGRIAGESGPLQRLLPPRLVVRGSTAVAR